MKTFYGRPPNTITDHPVLKRLALYSFSVARYPAADARAAAEEHERQAESFERAEQDQQATWWQAPGGPRSVAGGRSAVIRRGFAA